MARTINPYLVDGPIVYVEGTRTPLFGLPHMDYGNKPVEGGHLLLEPHEKEELERRNPAICSFIRPFMGSAEVVRGLSRYCIWIPASRLQEALAIPEIAERIDRVKAFRAKSTDKYVREKLLPLSYRFKQVFEARKYSFLIPIHTSEHREYLPVARFTAEAVVSNASLAIYDPPDWCLAIIASRLHLVWIATVCGKIKSDFRYSNTLGWNTFPVPKFTDEQKAALDASANHILRTRYEHYPKTIAELYDPDRMPDDLRQAHRENDELLETMYIGRPFRNDTERLERLFKLYAARVKEA
ncbi:UNVERIFIED_ORG: hypothetical protein BCL66_102262 [Martelella mediterranea]